MANRQLGANKYLVKLNRNNTNFTLQLFEYYKKAKWDHEYDFLKYYQNIVRIFMNDVDIDARGLLVQHEMGLGKSILAISVAIDLMKERQPIILLTKSLQENMRGAIKKYIKLRTTVEPDYHLGRLNDMQMDEWIEHNFSFVSMNASNMLKQMGKAAEGHTAEEFDAALEKKFGEVLKMASLDNKLLIVDEAHNLFRAITNGSKNGLGLYDLVMKARNLKVMFFTGTPIANDPFELVPCFNMLGSRTGRITLPEHYKDFNKLFVDAKNGRIRNKEKFQNRILGLVSYVSHLSDPGKAFGINDPSTKAEFPEEKPVVVERVHMDPDQFVMYGLARDKEMEEGSSSKFGGPSTRIVETPSMTKPKSHAASTYRVKSRQLSNFCAPSGLRDEKDPEKIPEQNLGSAKYRRAYENISKHKDQLGIVYSQFVGMGGLGTFSRYLDSLGWKRIDIGAPKKPRPQVDPVKAIEEFEKTEPGEQGELDEYANDELFTGEIIGDEKQYVIGKHEYSTHGPNIPPVGVYLNDVESELNKLPADTWWLGADDFDISYNTNAVVGGIDNVDDTDTDTGSESDTEFSIFDELVKNPESANSQISFKYAKLSDEDVLSKINPEYKSDPANFKYPLYILIILENGNPRGYVVIKYSIKEAADSVKYSECGAEMLEDHLDGISESLSRDIIKKIILDALACRDNPGEFKKQIWGGVADTRGISGPKPDRPRYYAVISGEVDVADRTRIQDTFNSEENKHGGVIDLILLSSTGAEGLDLKNVRHIHIMEPYWNWGRVKQIIARGVRNDSHKALPTDEKNVTPYIYLAVPPDTERLPNGEFPPTTDTELYDESVVSQITIESFNEAVREVSIECLVNGEDFCRVCNPSDQPLFTDDVERDIRATDPCSQVQETQVTAEEIIVDGVKYYYSHDPSSIYDYRIYIYDENINGYRALKESDPRYIKIINAIESAKSTEPSKSEKK